MREMELGNHIGRPDHPGLIDLRDFELDLAGLRMSQNYEATQELDNGT
jgi:hypothetical protein